MGTPSPLLTVGILALQGDYADHERALGQQGLATRRVRCPADLVGLDGIVLPGGESTTMLRLLQVEGLEGPLGELLGSGVPVLATCAGLILLARRVTGPGQRSYGLLGVDVERNGYGRQVHSGTFVLDSEGGTLPPGTAGLFIRAPRVVTVDDQVEVLARRNGDPVLVSQGSILGACFHPELVDDHPVMRRFAAMVRAGRAQPAATAAAS